MKYSGLVLGIVFLSAHAMAQESELLLPKAGEREEIHSYSNHTLSYNTSYRLSSWVGYWLKSSQTGNEAVHVKMKTDPNITFRAAEKSDYKKSGYDLGQYMNSIEVANNDKALAESYYLSNFMPMKPAFKKFIWTNLEDLIRYWSTEEDLQVFTGPVLTESPFATIGGNKVIVPKTVYKIVYSRQRNLAIGFVIKTGIARGSLKSFVKSVDAIEELTGIEFFSELPDAEEAEMEKQNSTDGWVWEMPGN